LIDPLFTEEKIVAMIFAECDTEGTGKVPVLKLMDFMLSKADQKLDRWVHCHMEYSNYCH
jgi:hypothetical protein